jgi:hypothetical protein
LRDAFEVEVEVEADGDAEAEMAVAEADGAEAEEEGTLLEGGSTTVERAPVTGTSVVSPVAEGGVEMLLSSRTE